MPRVSSEQRRRDFIAATVELILEEGHQAVTARKIAERAGASLGVVHYTFQDMDEVIRLANAEVHRIFFSALTGVRTDLGVRGFIDEFLRAYLRFIQENEKESLAFFETFVSLIRPQRASSSVVNGQRFLLDGLHEAAKHDPVPSKVSLAQLATLLCMIVDGITLIHFAREDRPETERDVDQLITALQCLL